MNKKIEKQTVTNIWYNTEEAAQFVLAPGSDSELSELDDDEDEDDDGIVQAPRVQPFDTEGEDKGDEDDGDHCNEHSKAPVSPPSIQELSETTSEDSVKHHQSKRSKTSLPKTSKTIVNTNNDDEDTDGETLNQPQLRRSKRQTTSAAPNYSNTSNVSFEFESEILESESDTSESESNKLPPAKKVKPLAKQNHTWR